MVLKHKWPIKTVHQYDLMWNFIKTWESIIEVRRKIKINDKNIISCCKWRLKTAWWYKWSYFIY